MTDEQFQGLVRQVQMIQDAQSEDRRRLLTLTVEIEQMRNMVQQMKVDHHVEFVKGKRP